MGVGLGKTHTNLEPGGGEQATKRLHHLLRRQPGISVPIYPESANVLVAGVREHPPAQHAPEVCTASKPVGGR